MEYIIVGLWLALVVCIICFLYKYLKRRKGFILQFQNYGKVDVPYVTLNIQGIPHNMVVDTGCGISIITEDTLKSLEFEESPRKISLSALTSDSVKSGVVRIPIEINGRVIPEDFSVYPGTDFGNFDTLYGIHINGLLGNEFLENTGCFIDYEKHAIILH